MSANLRSVSLAARQKPDPYSLPQRHNGDFSCNNSFLHSHFFFALENHNQGKRQALRSWPARERKKGEVRRKGRVTSGWKLEQFSSLLELTVTRHQLPQRTGWRPRTCAGAGLLYTETAARGKVRGCSLPAERPLLGTGGPACLKRAV